MKLRLMNMALKFIDIGGNLTDEMFQGIYHGKKKHEGDLSDVLQRAWNVGLEKIIITGTSLTDSQNSLKLSQTNNKLFCTVGCHPTRCNEFESKEHNPVQYLTDLLDIAQSDKEKVVAIGECGLDYERTNFCSIETQKKYFEKQITLAEVTGLPMFLHCRKAALDLVSILSPYRERISGAVVHSFDGTSEELKAILELDLFIGINGCSLKTEENLEVASQIPANRLMIETDCPWCEIRPTHAGFPFIKTQFSSKKKEKWERGEMVKSRNEPNCIIQVLEVLSAVRKEDKEELCATIYDNTCKLFFSNKDSSRT